MSLAHSPSIVTNGLILSLDAANRKSHIGAVSTSLINTNSWTVGSGGATGYNQNGNTGENARLYDTDPWGNQSIVWGTYASGDGGADGGWNTDYPSIDPTKLYRFSVWVRRTSSTSGGTFYFGTGAGGAEVKRTDNSATQSNPYWECSGTGILTQNQWYLCCGHVYPHFTSYTGRHPNTGYFTVAGGTTKVMDVNSCNIGQDLKWDSATTSALHRTYHYYCGDSTTRLQFAFPRMDICDGTEPSISELLNNGNSMWKDQSGYNNHAVITNTPTYDTTNKGQFTLDGSTQGFTRTSALSGATTNCTVVIWYSTTDVQELWVEGNNNTGYYLSASNNNNYYHSNCGSPTNYVDLNVVTNPYASGYKNGTYHMWEAKSVDFTTWSSFQWFLYPSGWQMAGNVATILVYNRVLTAEESTRNFNALKKRYGL